MRHFSALLLTAIVLASFLVVFVPAFLIRPFVPQTPRGLAIAYELRLLSPTTTLVLLLLGLPLIYSLARPAGSRLRKVLLSVAGCVLVASTIMARQNHFEWMFRPAPPPGYAEVSKAKHIEDSDMVLAIHLGSESRAYPVRIMAYHHLLNEVVAGQPVVVTY